MSKKDMLDDLKRSGLTEADAKKLKLKSLTPEQTYKLIKEKIESYEIPYFDINGKLIGFSRYRYIGKKKGFKSKEVKPQRYSQKRDTDSHLYFPPLVKWTDIAKDVSKSIIITEGEKKAAKSCKEGLPTIGLGGVWSFMSKRSNKEVIDDFLSIEWREREVSLLFDSDLATNENVKKALNKLAVQLTKLGAIVYIGYLKEDHGEKVGLDDFLLNHTIEDVDNLEYESYQLGPQLWNMNDEVAFLEDTGSYYVVNVRRLFTSNSLTTGTFASRRHSVTIDDKMKYVNTFSEWSKWPQRRTHSKLVYEPGQKLVAEDNSLNVWQGWGCEPKEGDVAIWHEFIDYLFSEDEDFKKWFIQWIAYPLQHPGTKLYTSVLLHGMEQGTGKSILGYIIGKIYGDNFGVISQEDMHGTFNEWSVNKQFLMGEELTGTDRRRDADRIKNLITREHVTVNAKFQPSYSVRDCINYLLNSNHPDAQFLEDKDRRAAVYEVNKEPKSAKFYKDLGKWKDGDGPSALFYYLLNEVDISKFDPNGKAPLTVAKQEMIDMSRSDLDAFAHSIIEDPNNVIVHSGIAIKRDLFTATELVDIYCQDDQQRPATIALSKALKRAGLAKMSETLTKSGSKKLWAVRNIDKWRKSDGKQRAAEYDGESLKRRKSNVVSFSKMKEGKDEV